VLPAGAAVRRAGRRWLQDDGSPLKAASLACESSPLSVPDVRLLRPACPDGDMSRQPLPLAFPQVAMLPSYCLNRVRVRMG
jgi:hypothetical protein